MLYCLFYTLALAYAIKAYLAANDFKCHLALICCLLSLTIGVSLQYFGK